MHVDCTDATVSVTGALDCNLYMYTYIHSLLLQLVKSLRKNLLGSTLNEQYKSRSTGTSIWSYMYFKKLFEAGTAISMIPNVTLYVSTPYCWQK